MLPIYDMIRQAQQGEALRQMGRQFGLDDRQMADAIAALAPAFSAGLKRNTAAPQPMADFLSALAEGHHRRYFEDVQSAFTPQAISEGNGILGHLFGSKDLSRQIAAQAAQATGIGPEALKAMLPVVANVLMGGLFKQAMGEASEPSASAPPQSGNVIGDILKQMIRYQASGRTDLPEKPKPSPFPNPFAEMMDAMFAAPRDASDGAPAGNPRAGDAVFGQMFEAGREVQAGYQKSMEAIVNQYLEGMQRHR
ncbi:DUF937 domain-containing protein [Pararhizobium haloflavum]|uniref:DUF937 domain-containing protein n=1 Tax=Pararhizobium haloflavum TaxID=2037914 RepID=UPI000C1759F7|nr:DUF937 domain-containing protein [Pararhizobium haloflavum]